MTPGSNFGTAPPLRGKPQREPVVRYEYRTVRIKNQWSRRRQDRAINEMAAQGWELAQRSPRGGLLGGGSDMATFRRPAAPGSSPAATGWDRLSGWWGGQGPVARRVWITTGPVLLAAVILVEVFAG